MSIAEHKQKGLPTTTLEDRIDYLVYKAYGLTPHDIKDVENMYSKKI